MRDGREDRVRERAYAIWEREGRPEGGAERHWSQAEQELRAEERGGTEAPAVEAARTAREAREATAAEPGPAPTTVPHG
jgi:hypothetical protein